MGKYNLWLDWEAYKIRHPEARQVLEWQEQYYKTFCGCPQYGENQSGQALELGGDTKCLKGNILG